jgi:hypothetical protein
MKTYCANVPTFDSKGKVLYNTVEEFTEERIIEEYWDRWKEQVKKMDRKDPEFRHHTRTKITKEHCIADWAASNWAWDKDYLKHSKRERK